MSADDFTDDVVSNATRQLEEWNQAHRRIKDKPPKDSRQYLKHALNLLPLFESIAELHPVAKAIVFSFRAIINFEDDRIENDLRVSGVLLSATDMMSVVLEIAIIATQEEEDSEVISSNEDLLVLLQRIQADLKACGNSIDTYYKSSKLAKFLKSQEWKGVMTEYSQTFINHRTNLHTILSLRITRAVDNLGAKMKILIAQAFTPQRDWEKNLQKKLKEYGPKENWIHNTEKVKELIKLSEDPMIDRGLLNVPDDPAEAASAEQRLATFIAGLNQEISTSLRTLFDRNMGIFEQKLDFHTQELQDSIEKSAKYVVRALAGPYDRLQHEDLRKLWKEMNWIFCVEDKLFTIALFEYYLDYFNSKYSTRPIGSDEEPRKLSQEELNKRREDLWTLPYLSKYGEKINEAVDTDKSGFIRISEVNVFTSQIPPGWTLPQYCAYVAVGWEYELHIYQKRLQHLMDKFYEAQAIVHPDNRVYLLYYLQQYFLPILLSRGPTKSESDFSNLPSAFRSRIREKISAQDERMRNLWKKFKYRMDDSGTIGILYSGRDLETYILQLLMIFMEHTLDIVAICKTQRIDLREWRKLDSSLVEIKTLLHARIEELEGRYSSQDGTDIQEFVKSHYGGLLRAYYIEHYHNDDCPVTEVEAEQRLSHLFILDDFPIPEPNVNTEEVLEYQTWEQHLEGMDEDYEVPDIPPPVWGATDEFYGGEWSLPERDHTYPFHLTITCDLCKRYPLTTVCFHCIDCDDYDVCGDCHKLPLSGFDPENVSSHAEDHTLVRFVLYFPHEYRAIARAIAEHRQEEHYLVAFRDHFEKHGYVTSKGDEGDGEGDDEGEDEGEDEDEGGNEDDESTAPENSSSDHRLCVQCGEEISSERFFQCIHQDCLDHHHYVCLECAATYTQGDEEAGGDEDEDEEDAVVDEEGNENTRRHHKWWHTLLLLQNIDDDFALSDDDSEAGQTNESEGTLAQVGGSILEDRVGAVEKRLEAVEIGIAAMNTNVGELKGLLEALLDRLG
ncbi:hypothetical protein CC2G_011403 [Coprinopsis cinerea AmutBmut pab1-1]|nr:hypothetical protein CC2G_011403 [Coprinopsis cinerea AmutBmut pab1-1]